MIGPGRISLLATVLALGAFPPCAGADATGFRPVGDASISIFSELRNAGRLDAIAPVPGAGGRVLYVGANGGGVWRTGDGGRNWEPLTDRQASLGIGAVATDPSGQHVIASTDLFRSVLLVSHDEGRTWRELEIPYVQRIVFDPERPGVVYAIGVEGLLRSDDWGETWRVVFERADDVALLPGARRRVVVATENAVFLSADGSAPWTEVPLPAPPDGRPRSLKRTAFVISCPGDRRHLYVGYGARGDAIFASDDGGATFEFRGRYAGTFTRLAFACSGDGRTVYIGEPANNAGGNTAVNRSRDGGRSWAWLTGAYHPDVQALVAEADPPQLHVGTDGGLFRFDERSGMWTGHNGNLGTLQFKSAAAAPTAPDRLLGGTQDNGLLVFHGSDWLQIQCGDGGDSVLLARDPNRGWGTCIEVGGTDLIRVDGTIAGRVDCAAPCEERPRAGPFAIDPTRPARVCAADRGRIKCSDHLGDGAWDVQSPDIGAKRAVLIDRERAWAQTSPVRLHRTVTGIDGRWFPADGDLPAGRALLTIDPLDDLHGLALLVPAVDAPQVYETTDGGVRWNPVGVPVPLPVATPAPPCLDPPCDVPPSPPSAVGTGQAFAVDFPGVGRPEMWFVATIAGLLVSSDRGATWEDSDVPHVMVMEVRVGPPGVVTVATYGRGVWQRDGRPRPPTERARAPVETSWWLRVVPFVEPFWASDLIGQEPTIEAVRLPAPFPGASFRRGDEPGGRHDFRIAAEQPFFVKGKRAAVIELEGTPPPRPFPVALVDGWNAIGPSVLSGRRASDLLADLALQGIRALAIQDGERTLTFDRARHQPGGPEDFQLSRTSGYWLLVKSHAVWRPGAGTQQDPVDLSLDQRRDPERDGRRPDRGGPRTVR